MGAFRPMPGVTLQGWQPLRPTMGALRPSTPGVCEGLAAPTPPDLGAPPQPPGVCAGLVAPTPPNLGAPPQTPGDFPVAGKVTKGAPGAAPLDPWYEVPALFALAALRSGSRRAGFCHRKRPICHFEMVGESVLLFPLALTKKNILLLIRDSAGFWLHVWVQLLGGFGV